MFDLITILTASRYLRRACEARAINRDDFGAEHEARVALLDLARGIEIEVYPSRPSRWTGTDAMARNVEAAAEALAEAAEAPWQRAGCIARLSLHFGALASRMGCDVDAKTPATASFDEPEDEAARRYAEGHVQEAAE